MIFGRCILALEWAFFFALAFPFNWSIFFTHSKQIIIVILVCIYFILIFLFSYCFLSCFIWRRWNYIIWNYNIWGLYLILVSMHLNKLFSQNILVFRRLSCEHYFFILKIWKKYILLFLSHLIDIFHTSKLQTWIQFII